MGGNPLVVKNDSGQAVTEYILLLAVVTGLFLLMFKLLPTLGIMKKLATPITGSYAKAYQYGHTRAKGYDDGGPENHPRATGGGTNNFRIFLNPEIK